MKNRIYILAFVFLLIFNACSDEFLERSSSEEINTSSYYNTAEDAMAAINTAYNPLQRAKLYNLRMWATDIIAGNSEVGGNPSDANDAIETKKLASFIADPDNSGVLDMWRGPWPGILYCNIVLDKIPDIDMSSGLKTRILGEAHFLRGVYYFMLVRFFGDVPLLTESNYEDAEAKPYRTAKNEIYELIISDLTNALEMLPFRESYSGSDIGRASKGAAAGILAKVYLTLGKTDIHWNRVVSLCDTLATWGYDLNTDYADNYDPDAENSVESLFEIQYTGESTDFWSDENWASYTTNFMGPRDSPLTTVGWGWNQPTQEFVDAYEDGDLRKDITLFYEGCPSFDSMDYKSSYAYATGYNVRKFILPKSYISSSSSGSPLNFPVLRYADVLLMKAEALNELGNTSEAEIPLNLVRNRAGLSNIETGLSKSAFREKVLHERRIEMAFEGDRWFDLVRINDGQYALDFLHSIGKINATSKHLLFPIPQLDIDANPNLVQNPGY